MDKEHTKILKKLDKIDEKLDRIGMVVWSTKEGRAIREMHNKLDDEKMKREFVEVAKEKANDGSS